MNRGTAATPGGDFSRLGMNADDKKPNPAPELIIDGIISTICNAGMLCCAWLATHGNPHAGNIIKLISALTAILTPLVALVWFKPGDPIPRWREWISHIIDCATVFILAWYGWIWCSMAIAAGWFAAAVLFERKRVVAKMKG